MNTNASFWFPPWNRDQYARAAADDLRKRVAKRVNRDEQNKHNREAARDRMYETLTTRYLAEIKNEASDRFKRSADQDGAALNKRRCQKWKSPVTTRSPGPMSSSWRRHLGRRHADQRRGQALISGVFSFPADSDLLDAKPSTRLKKQGRQQSRTRVLSDGELRLFWPRIIQSPVTLKTGTRLAPRTIARSTPRGGYGRCAPANSDRR